MDWKIPCTIENLLKLRCLKWACMMHLDIWNTSYGQKKGRESNWQFDSRPLKVENRPDFLACRWCATYHWEDLEEGYNFASDLISIGMLHTKLWGPKVGTLETLGISGLSLGSPGTKCHLDVGLVERYKVTIRGKVVASPKSEPWWVLWIRICLWLVLTPKVFQLCTDQLVVCRFVWVVKCLSFFLVSSRNSNTPFYPQSVASQGACPQPFTISLFSL
jgi:hypothetical protein